jgi:hypothetical protein
MGKFFKLQDHSSVWNPLAAAQTLSMAHAKNVLSFLMP